MDPHTLVQVADNSWPFRGVGPELPYLHFSESSTPVSVTPPSPCTPQSTRSRQVRPSSGLATDSARASRKGLQQYRRSRTNQRGSEPRKFGAQQAAIVRDICQVLRNMTAGLDSRVHVGNDLDLGATLQQWHGSVTNYLACEVLKQLDDPVVARAFFKWAQGQPSFKPDAYVYTTLIGVMGRAKYLDRVGEILREMKANGCLPTVVTFNRIMYFYGRANLMPEVEQLLQQMKGMGIKPDYVSFSTLIDGYVKAGMHSRAMESYDAMRAAGIAPDEVVLTTLMNSFGRIGELPKACEIFQDMVASGQAPNIVSWNTLIDVHGKAGRPQMAVQLFHDMVTAGVRPDLLTYSTLIDICGKGGQFQQAEDLFSRMLREGYEPDTIVWSMMVTMWGRAGQPQKAAVWFNRMRDSGARLTVAAFNSLIFTFLRGGMYPEAKLVFEGLWNSGLQPSLYTYTLLLSECTNHSEQHRVHQHQGGDHQHNRKPSLPSSGTGVVPLLLDLMEATAHPAHDFLKAVLRRRLQVGGREAKEEDAALWADAWTHWGELASVDVEERRAFADAVMAFLHKCGLKRRAQHIWEQARSSNAWANAMQEQSSVVLSDIGAATWHLNVHSMSAGTAVVALCSELLRLREVALGTDSTVFPRGLEIITGWGRRSRVSGASKVKQHLEALLIQTGSPFVEDRGNVGRLVAEGEKARAWLRKPGVGSLLTLEDAPQVEQSASP
eukprot:TRINITY_DN39150_c0_g1_i1.p1 TRINITY_DN39150_c0_g1~~TRINITY_DN39150_c0_g1_i1.p1  ORF type:complete len:776 (-),score=103.59 TRINITY_DN39150_c0_g1_i1:395-2557(-)